MKKIILHIGMWKTGTTSIQETMYTNRDLLKRNAVYYPDEFSNNIFFIPLYKKDFENHVAVKSNPSTKEELLFKSIKAFENFKTEAKNYDTAIFSSEFLLDLSEEEVTRLANDLKKVSENIQIICYVRSPISHFTSAVNEQVKQGHYPLEVAFERHMEVKEYLKLERWKKAFGADAVDVRVFERNSFVKGGLIEDFLDTAGLTLVGELIPKDKENQTLSAFSILIADVLAKKYPSFSPERGNTDFLFKIKGKPYRVPSKLVNMVSEKNRKNTDYLAKEYGVVFSQESYLSDDVLYDEEAINSIANILHSQQSKIKKLYLENAYLKAQLSAESNDLNKAKEQFLLALELDSFEVYRDYASLCLKLNDKKNALKYAMKANDIIPGREWVKEMISLSE